MHVYNSDLIYAKKDYNQLASMFFRLDSDKVIHERHVFQFSDWLASIAGIERLLLRVIIFGFGGYAQFNASIELINQQYR
jgi:ABC-type uncharacterized transport system permease subunit